MKRRRVLATLGSLASVSWAGCTAPVADCPRVEWFGEEVCPGDELGVRLEVEPATVSLPAELTFTVRNRTDRGFEFAPDRYPFVYEREGTDWTEITGGRRLIARETVTVTDLYAFTVPVPLGDDDLDPGDHLFLVPGRLETPDGGERQVNLVDRVAVAES